MKKFFPLLLALGFVTAMLAEDYKILQMNTTSIKIGNRICKKGDVFSDDAIIIWTKEKQAIKAQNLQTKEMTLFTEHEFKSKNSKTIKEYYIKKNHLSSRWIGLSELSEQLNNTFYLLDTIRIESPLPMDSTQYFYIRYNKDISKKEKVLPTDNDIFMITRSLFEPNDSIAVDETIISVLLRSKNVDDDYLLTDSMRIIMVPLCIEE